MRKVLQLRRYAIHLPRWIISLIKIIPESVLLSGEMKKLGQTMENNFLFYRGVRIHLLLFLNSKEHLFRSLLQI